MNRSWSLNGIIVVAMIVCLVLLFQLGGRMDHQRELQQIAIAQAAAAEPVPPDDKTVYEKFKAGKIVHYLVVGDSIGESDGADAAGRWFLRLNEQLRTQYEAAVFSQVIATPGGRTIGGWIDYISTPKNNETDMVILCFGQNDQSGPADVFGASYEALVRQIKKDYPDAEIVTLIESSLSKEEFANRIKAVSSKYGLLNVDTRLAFKASGLPYNTLTNDGTHPNSKGYTYYVQAIMSAIESRLNAQHPVQPLPNSLLYDDTSAFDSGARHADWNNVQGFTADANGVMSGKAGSSMEQAFQGTLLGVEVWADKTGGDFNVYVDGKLTAKRDNSCPFRVNWEHYISHKLGVGSHTVRIEVPAELPLDHTVQIAGIITN